MIPDLQIFLRRDMTIHDIHDVMFYTEAPKKDLAFATSFEFKQYN